MSGPGGATVAQRNGAPAGEKSAGGSSEVGFTSAWAVWAMQQRRLHDSCSQDVAARK